MSLRRLSLLLLILGLCTAGLLLAGARPAQAKPPKGITWDAQIGYSKLAQKGRVNPVIVDMENKSAGTNLSGDLVLEYGGVEYATRLELPTPSKKRFFLYFPCEDYPPTVIVRVRTKSYTEEKTLSAFNNTIDASDLNVLVLTRQKGSLNAINQQTSARIMRDVYNAENAQVGAADVFVSYLRPDECDPNPKFFTGADVIVLADLDYQQMDREMAEALKACLAGGKTLVFSLGSNAAGVAGSPLAEVCPLSGGGTTTTSDLGAFGRSFNISAANAPAILASGQLQPGSEVLSWAGKYPAIVRRNWGAGTAIALAFDFTQQPFKLNPGVARVFNDYVFRVDDAVQINNEFMHPEPLAKILGALTEAKPMSPGFVFAFLAIYVVLIGPLNFLILDRFKRRTLVWTTIPLIVAGFSFLGLRTGYLQRGGNNVTAYLQELHVFPGAAYTPYQTVMLIFTAERTKYTLQVPDKSAYLYANVPVAQPSGMAPQTGLGLFSGGRIDNSAEPTIRMTQGKWDPKTYYYQGYVGQQASVTSRLSGVRGKGGVEELSGGFDLDLPYDLHECYLYAPGYELELGNLAGKGSYSLDTLKPGPGDDLNREDNYLVASIKDLEARQKAASQLAMRYRNEALLVGFNEEIDALAKFGGTHKEYHLNMVVVHLPYSASVDTSGDLNLAHALVIGGKDFSTPSQRWGMYQVYDEAQGLDQVTLKQNGYLDMEYELAGDLNRDSQLHISLPVADRQDQPVKDVADFMKVEVRVGDHWQQLKVADGRSVDVPVGGLLGPDRKLTLRFTSTSEEINFTLPDDDRSVY